MNNFLKDAGWTVQARLGEDGSPRTHTRVEKDGRTAILVTYQDPSYPGHALGDYIRIGDWLRDIGLSAPEIYEADEAAGLLLVEDFRDSSFRKALEKGRDERELYTLAADVLAHLRRQDCPLALPDYFESHVHHGHRRVIDWYVPAVRAAKNPDELAAEYLAVWAEIERDLPPADAGFMHIDFHADNLMFLPQRQGPARLGILDFQGALRGPGAYDLGNLLEDARMSVPDDLRAALLAGQDEGFLRRYRVLTTQFHCRVIGQFIKLAVRQGKTGYLHYIPQVAKYIREALSDPVLAPLAVFFDENKIDFLSVGSFHSEKIQAYIGPDAV